MFCPSCATEVNDQTKYCTRCGFDLRLIKGTRVKGGSGVKSKHNLMRDHWGELELEKQREKRKRSPEEKRLNEIKSGVITSSVGLGLMIFLGFLFEAVADSVGGPGSNIIRAIPFVGIIPFLIGLGIIFNGLIIGKRIVNLRREQEERDKRSHFSPAPETAPAQQLPEAAQAPITDFSVTEPTTTRLREPAPISSQRDTK
jgi:hypothetical protein